MKYILSVLILFIAVPAFTQDCNMESLLKKQGTWKETSNTPSGIAAADLAKEKKTVAAINAMIKSKYKPAGVNAEVNGGYNHPQPGVPVNSFVYSIIPLNFYCDGNVIKTVGETPTYFSINTNIFDAEIYESPDNKEETSGLGYHYIKDMPFEKDGYWHFKTIDASLGLGMTGKSNSWLITYDGKLPFAYVTHKEFLETRKIILANARAQSASQSREALDRLEMEKGFKEKEYKNDPEKLKRYMKMDYTDSKVRYEKLLRDNEKTYQPAFEKIDAQLKMPAAELNQPAIVKMDPHDHLSCLFTDDNDPFGQILIKPNPGYFNKKIPKSAPQFFWVYVIANHKEPITANFMSDIIKAVDFSLLKNMLGK
ncbi:MAG TPA: hypothetical protein VF487_15790 [Chitinophagaceae bacterium]